MPTTALAAERHLVAARPSRTHVIAQLLSLSPFWILLAVAADPQTRLLAPFQPVPHLLGVQADALLGTVTLLWMAVGALIVRYGRSPLTEALGLLLFTIPATTSAVLTPALLFALAQPG